MLEKKVKTMSIRSAAKAVIINDGKILLNKCRDNTGEYYTLPGGGQNQCETLHEAVIRECLEETGYKVKPIKFTAMCEGIMGYLHKIYHIFICELANKNPITPTEKDGYQIDSVWINIDSLSKTNLLPKIIGDNIHDIINGTNETFLGIEYIKI